MAADELDHYSFLHLASKGRHIMKRKWLFLSLALLLALIPFVLASANGIFDLSWWSVDGGGDRSGGGAYSLLGVAGQPDAGLLHGGDFSLAGGYLGGAVVLPPTQHLFLPLVIRP
jgi:uncharacterized membrane protein